MSQALYRKYRSRRFSDVVGQEHITTTLDNALKAGRISHAYLFTGPKGVGKTSVARILAHAINKLEYSDTSNLDIIEIDAASNRRIDDIRDLREKVHIAPVSAPYKVYIIDEAHMLTNESFNALLKTLEEPPAHVVFILATTEAHKLPATIVSRTQRFSFHPAKPDMLEAHLKNIAKKEGIKIANDALALIAEHADGSFRDSLSLLDQLAHSGDGEITTAQVISVFGLVPTEMITELVTAIRDGQVTTVAALIAQLEAEGSASTAITNQLSQALLKAATEEPRLYELVDRLLDVPRAYNPRLKLLSVLMTSLPAPTPEPQVIQVAPIVIEPAVDTMNSEPATAAMTDFSAEMWQTLLEAIQKNNAPFYTVLKHADTYFDIASQTLTLGFKYQLHRKKLDDPKSKIALARAMTNVFGSVPTIRVVQGTPKPPDPRVSSVAAIMGGGEVIDT